MRIIEFYNLKLTSKTLDADYQGSSKDPYHISFTFEPFSVYFLNDFTYKCTCPAKVNNCKHVDALILYFLDSIALNDPKAIEKCEIGRLFGVVGGVNKLPFNNDSEPTIRRIEPNTFLTLNNPKFIKPLKTQEKRKSDAKPKKQPATKVTHI